MELIIFMEYLTLVVTLCMFSTGIVPCMNMYKTRSTKNVPYVLFLISVISCSGMVHYGLILGISTLVFINLVGASLNAIYTLLYISVAEEKRRPLLYLACGVIYVCGLYYRALKLVPEAEMAETLGKSSSSLTTILVCLPALEAVGNFMKKDAEGMPLVMLFGGLACSVSWLIYGMMLDDANIYMPNIPGIACSLFKLSAIAAYGGTRPKQE